MKLHSISYIEYEKETYAWVLDEFTLIDINLIVGKNATGKSRVLRLINGLARLIEGSLQPNNIASGHYQVVFKDTETTKRSLKPDISYEVDIHDSKVKKEVLVVGGIVRLNRRDDGRGSIYFEKNDATIDIQVPQQNLAATVRRDEQQHSFFEELHVWANTVRYFEFSKVEKNVATSIEGKVTMDMIKSTPLQDNLHLVIKMGKANFNREFSSAVISDMRKIGYEITDFGLSPLNATNPQFQAAGSPQTLFVEESGIEKKLLQHEISDGMLRALSTLIHLHFIRLQKRYGCILIDDIGEGLDFDRSTKLISLVIEQAKKGFMQIVLTTNDRFVMNKVPLDYWSVIRREQGKVKVSNPRNNPTRFMEFEEFGLNNFDFFANNLFI